MEGKENKKQNIENKANIIYEKETYINSQFDFELIYEKIKEMIFEEVSTMYGGIY